MLLRLILAILIFGSTSFTRGQSPDASRISNELEGGERLDDEEERRVALKEVFNKLQPIGDTSFTEQRPVVVSVNAFIRNIQYVDDLKMEFKMDLTLRQNWHNDSLSSKPLGVEKVIVDEEEIKKYWKPDTFFGKEIWAQRHMIDKSNSMIRIGDNGSVSYSTRIAIVVHCPMEFSKFPFDDQKCIFDIASYGHSEEHIVYEWDRSRPVEVANETRDSLMFFELTNITNDSGSQTTSTGRYSFVRIIFHFQRMIGYYFMQVFVPTAVLVITSWTAFFIHPSKITARIMLEVALLCTLIIFIYNTNADFPKTAYTRAIDIWFGVSLVAIFFAIPESIFAAHFYEAPCQNNSCYNENEEQLMNVESRRNKGRWKKTRRISKTDLISRLLFPILFISFSIVYFGINMLII